MKILFDARVHLNYYSGISRYIICLLDAYLKLHPNDEVDILLNPSIEKDNSIYSVLQAYPNVRFHTIDLPHMGPRNYVSMKKVINSFEADVYHYPHLDAPYKTGKTPMVATIHDANYSRKIKKFNDPSGLKTKYFKWAITKTLKHAKKVLFVSESVKNELSELYKYASNENRFQVMHNGLEEDFNRIDQQTLRSERESLNLPSSYFLYVGQIREHKNIKRIIAAFNEFQKINSEIHLVLAGHNYLNENLGSDRIHQLNEVSNNSLKVLYHDCQAVVFPSLFEGFGFPIIEGFSFGKSVITSNRGATAEIGKGNAILVDPESVEAIKEGMVESAAQDFRNEEKVEYSKSFNWETNAIQLREVYLEAIK